MSQNNNEWRPVYGQEYNLGWQPEGQHSDFSNDGVMTFFLGISDGLYRFYKLEEENGRSKVISYIGEPSYEPKIHKDHKGDSAYRQIIAHCTGEVEDGLVKEQLVKTLKRLEERVEERV